MLHILFFSGLYEITDDSNVNEIWRPIIAFGHLMDYKKTMVYGGDKPFFFWFTNWSKYEFMVYHEEVQLSFACPFNFTNYPFDSHVCNLEFGCPSWPASQLRLQPPKIKYEHVSQTLQHSLADKPIIISDLPHPFEFEFNFKPAFEKIQYQGISSSYVGMEIKMKRKLLGELLCGYYYPMAAFALLSMISFLIKADVVSKDFYIQVVMVTANPNV